jgi:hypothetical protein
VKGAVLYGPRDVRFEERSAPENCRADGCNRQDIRNLRIMTERGDEAVAASKT